jgi:uncharacterized protein YdaU (DUF1376 family)
VANSDLPYFPFYPHDFMLDENVVAMSAVARGIYVSMLCHQWEHGSVPNKPAFIARLASATDEEVREALAGALGPCWPEDMEHPGRLVNPRLALEFDKAAEHRSDIREKRSAAGKKSVAVRREQMLSKCSASAEQSEYASASVSVSESTPTAVVDSAADPEVLEVPVEGNNPPWPVRQSYVAAWEKTFPHLDVVGELRRAVQWLLDNPERGKTAKGMRRYLGSWLQRAQDGGRGMKRQKASAADEIPMEWGLTPAESLAALEASTDRTEKGRRSNV